jgi:four helix bundle protein
MKHQSFEDLLCWQKSYDLSKNIYLLMRPCKDYSFKDQVQRASVSVMNNIAEGYERGGQKELRYFLFIAKGSCGEVRSMLLLARDLSYISDEDFENLNSLCVDTSKMLAGFIKKIQ